jgi:hypothetical protein
MKYGFLTDLNVTKIAEAGFGVEVMEHLRHKYPYAENRIIDAHQAGRALWRYNEDLIFNSVLVGQVRPKAGDITDFSSVPRTPLTFWIAGDTAHASAGIHDELCNYWVPSGRITWRQAANVFREAMICEETPAWRRWLMFNAVVGADPANKTEAAQ